MTTTAGMMLRYRADLGCCDLVVRATANGRGRVRTDSTLASALLSQLGSDRRADATDNLPNAIALLPAQGGGAFSRRGWPGDMLLPTGTRQGSRLWLLSRGKASETDRVAAIGYAAEAVAPVAQWSCETIQTTATWLRAGILQVTATVSGVSITVPAGSA
ncbi:phage GP46 family protein [Acetobacter sp. DsW_063]|uniref:phage GP46 family protein n=1 Tax=Acetobacter sp. DsW_063 TaxID=1514894 RepID=UPI000A3907DC|nr:phage GP46 family protein [Acetobacter sp. DsW_063]